MIVEYSIGFYGVKGGELSLPLTVSLFKWFDETDQVVHRFSPDLVINFLIEIYKIL